jgi:hypothetical protein
MTVLASGRGLYIGSRLRIDDASETTCSRCNCPVWVGEMHVWAAEIVCLSCSDDLIRRLVRRAFRYVFAGVGWRLA